MKGGIRLISFLFNLLFYYIYINPGKDVKGNVFVWATDDGEHNTKYEYQPLSGRINDISWDNSNGRLAVVGEGREKLVVLFSKTQLDTKYELFFKFLKVGFSCAPEHSVLHRLD